MATNVVRECGSPKHTTTKNIASAKTSSSLIAWPLTAAAGNPVALLLKDAASGELNVPVLVGGVVVKYAALSTDVGDPGTVVYFDIGNNRLTVTASTHQRAGRLATPKANGDTTADFILNEP